MINKYLPLFLQELNEYKETNKSLDVELDNIKLLQQQVLTNLDIDNATEEAISSYERSLGIVDSVNLPLYVRKFKIKLIYSTRPPFTKNWMLQSLSRITNSDTGYQVNIQPEQYKVAIKISSLDSLILQEIQKTFRETIPAHLILEIGSDKVDEMTLYYSVVPNICTHYIFNS
jgi:hypothetical protein